MMFDMSVWLWPQWTMFILQVVNLIIAAILHNQPKTGKHSFPVAIVGLGLGFFTLVYGGFYS